VPLTIVKVLSPYYQDPFRMTDEKVTYKLPALDKEGLGVVGLTATIKLYLQL
jgi:hypothetical protein